jgi:hypothetical protein
VETCDNFYSSFQFTDRADYFEYVASHKLTPFAGSDWANFGCDTLDVFKTAMFLDDNGVKSVCDGWMNLLKHLYRENLITPTTGCVADSKDVTKSKCAFICEDVDVTAAYAATWIEDDVLADVNADTLAAALGEFICGKDGNAGRIFASDTKLAEANDPSFWSSIPGMDRALQMKLMLGGFATTTWPTDAVNEFVCVTPSCYNSNTKLVDEHDDCCYGHFEEDQVMDFSTGDTKDKTLDTNKQTYDLLNPLSEMPLLTYIYDNIGANAFAHCDKDFEAMFTEQSEGMKSLTTMRAKESRYSTSRDLQHEELVSIPPMPEAQTHLIALRQELLQLGSSTTHSSSRSRSGDSESTKAETENKLSREVIVRLRRAKLRASKQ